MGRSTIYGGKKDKGGYLFIGLLLMWLLSAPSLWAQETPRVSTHIDTTSIRIGEQIKYTISVDTDTTAVVVFPEGQTFSPLETVEILKTDTTRNKDRMTLQRTYALTQFDSGVYKLPTQRIQVNGQGYFTDSLLVHVATVPVDTLKQKMYDIKGLRQVKNNPWRYWKLILAILAILAIGGGLLYWFVWRKKALTEAEKVALLPPYDRALLELKQLENSKHLIRDEYKEYYSELTDIVRSYLEEDVHITALESTTDQLLAKLELLKDSGELKIQDGTLNRFKQILQTADLVKFARSKPPTSQAEDDRRSIESIVTETHEALPEPSEEEQMDLEAYQEALKKRQRRRKWQIAASIATLMVISLVTVGIVYYGPTKAWDTVTGHPTKKLLDGEWVTSWYGYPPIELETPEVLIRQDDNIPADQKEAVKESQTFAFHDEKTIFTVAATSVLFTQPAEPELDKTVDQLIKNFESKGVRNIITKQDEFTTVNGIKGFKTYGSGSFPVPGSDRTLKGKYTILSFGGQGFQQQVMITWPDGDPYSEQIVERILATLKVKTDV